MSRFATTGPWNLEHHRRRRSNDVYAFPEGAAERVLGPDPEWLETHGADGDKQRFGESLEHLSARRGTTDVQETAWVQRGPRGWWYALEPGED
jgi:hypothetical protein